MFTSILVFTVIAGVIMVMLGILIPAAVAFALGQQLHLGVYDIEHGRKKMGYFWSVVAIGCWILLLITAGCAVLFGEHGVMMFADTIGFIVLAVLFTAIFYCGYRTTAFANTDIKDPLTKNITITTDLRPQEPKPIKTAKVEPAAPLEIKDSDIEHLTANDDDPDAQAESTQPAQPTLPAGKKQPTDEKPFILHFSDNDQKPADAKPTKPAQPRRRAPRPGHHSVLY